MKSNLTIHCPMACIEKSACWMISCLTAARNACLGDNEGTILFVPQILARLETWRRKAHPTAMGPIPLHFFWIPASRPSKQRRDIDWAFSRPDNINNGAVKKSAHWFTAKKMVIQIRGHQTRLLGRTLPCELIVHQQPKPQNVEVTVVQPSQRNL